MDFINPFAVKGSWYKGNLHTHTTNSDGQFSPEEICRIYGKAGYDFLCITDHNKLTKVKEPGNLTLLQGAEMNTGYTHIVAVDLKEEFNPEGMSVQQIIDAVNLQGALSIIAHPYWSALTVNDLLALRGYAGIEIYNHLCHNLLGKGYSTVHFDGLLQAGRKTPGFAADDAHSERDLSAGFVMVKAPSGEKDDILSSIKKECFYSSTGVMIKDLRIDEDSKTVKIRFSPAVTVDFIAHNSAGKRFSAVTDELEYAEYEIKGNEKYLRIEITDKNNRKAWINPVFL